MNRISKIIKEEINLIKLKDYLYDYFNLNNVIEPASIPIKNDNYRLYHQTSYDNFKKIRNDKEISIDNSTGTLNKEPNIVWGKIINNSNENGFYDDPKEYPTIEYQIPKREVDDGTGGVARSINKDEIIAYHDPKLFNLKNIIDNYDTLNVIATETDNFIDIQFKNAPEISSEHAIYLIAKAISKMSKK